MPSAKVVQRDAHAEVYHGHQQQQRLRRVKDGVVLNHFQSQQAEQHGVALKLFLH